ncbi:putative tetratricopeptide-like helical domain superfamily [Dioscorea sansibarensis]
MSAMGSPLRTMLERGGRRSLIFSENLKLSQLARSGRIDEAIKVFSSMTNRNTVTWNCMISAYAKNGRVSEARALFDRMPFKNLVSWNTMIAGYSHNGCFGEAYELFDRMPKRDQFSWTLMITCLSRNGELEKARRIFDAIPGEKNSVLSNAMISGYAKNRRFHDAFQLLDEMPMRDLVSWNSVLAGYTQNEEMLMAVKFFNEKMPEKDVFSWNLIVDGFVRIGDWKSAWKFFERIPNPNVVSWVTMLNGLVRSGRIAEARRLFDQMPERNVVSWNAMLSGYVQSLQIDDAFTIFMEMPERNSVSWTAMINGYARVGKLKEAKELLDKMSIKCVGAQTALMSGYIQHNRMDDAHRIFEEMHTRDVVCWNTMIAGYCQCGRVDEAKELFKRMPKKDMVSWNTMITGYAQEGQIDEALRTFQEMGEKNTVSWNSIISAFTQNGFYIEALQYIMWMRREGKKSDWSTFACALSACAHLAAYQAGKQLHPILLKSGYVNNLFAGNALISMYARCGRISRAKQVFDELEAVDLVSWNSLIAGYALSGNGNEAILLFRTMVRSGIKPDEVTFVGVLSACSHSGLIKAGLDLFRSMSKVYAVKPAAEHFACIVDLLGRAGMLEEAYELVAGMQIDGNAGVWGALLGACRIYRNAGLANIASEKLGEFEPCKSSIYVLLSNIHADAGRWDEVERTRVLMKERGVKKQAGCSWVEIKNKLCEFFSDYPKQPRTAQICLVLETLTAQMRNTGPMLGLSALDCG